MIRVFGNGANVEENIFNKIARPFIIKTTEKISDFDNRVNYLRSMENRFVTFLRGERMKNVGALLNEIASSLQFPYYFGDNWNSLYDCINDLDWLSATSFIIAISNCEAILSEETEEDCLAFGKLLFKTCSYWSEPSDEDQEWGRPGRPFHVIMQCENEKTLERFGDIFF